MSTTRITPRQRELLDCLSKHAAFSHERARAVPEFDEVPAEKLAQRGVLNKRYVSTYGAAYWIRSKGEEATGTNVPAGFIVILHRDVMTPLGEDGELLPRALPTTAREPRSGTSYEAGCSPWDYATRTC